MHQIPFAAQAPPPAILGTLDLVLFFVAVIGVIALGIWQGTKGKDGGGHGGGGRKGQDKCNEGRMNVFIGTVCMVSHR